MKKVDKKYAVRRMILIFADVVTLILSYMTALLARFDFVYRNIDPFYTDTILRFIPAAIVIYLVVYYCTRLYHSIWRYVSVKEAQRIIIAYIIIAVLLIALNCVPRFNIPRSVLFYGYVLSLFWCAAIRFGYRMMRSYMISSTTRGIDKERVMIIGAGFAAVKLLRNTRFMGHYRVVALIDDNPSTWGMSLEGIKIEGGREKIVECADKFRVNTIVFAIPSAAREVKGEIIEICKETGCKLQTVPGMGADEESRLQNIRIGDMLGRDLIDPNRQAIDNQLAGKTVLITGAAGTVGSMLAKRVAESSPREIILVDMNEPKLYEIRRRVGRVNAGVKCTVVYGDVALLTAKETGSADYVFHAASYESLDDRNRDRIVENNLRTLEGVRRIAADASKLVLLRWSCKAEDAEREDRELRTNEMIVRMGPVLGSNGDIVKLFQKEIDEGGPVTIPNPNMVRSYITPEEAAEFILMASFDANADSDVTVDEGVPVRIDDLVEDLVKLNGYRKEEMKVVYTGEVTGYR